MKNYIKYISILSLALVACEPEFDNEVSGTPAPQSSGEADFSTYVALGNSLTAGVADQTLYIDGQQVAFPVLMAEQMKAAGGGEFTVPFMADNIGGFPGIPETDPETGDPIPNTLRFPPRLVFNASTRLPELIEGVSTTNPTTILDGPFNNMGVPGAKSFHLGFSGYGNVAGLSTGTSNPFFVRFASEATTSVLADALAQQPTFFSLWIGGNDVLSYATSGGIGKVQSNEDALAETPPGQDDITNPGFFNGAFNGIVDALTATGAKGLVANVPDVKSLPFFTTVPYNPVPMDAATAERTNMAYAAYNGGLQLVLQGGAISPEEVTKRTIRFSAGQNPVVILDENLTNLTAINPALVNIRQATAEDLLVLSSRNFIGTEAVPGNPASINGVAVPLADKWVLTPEEQANIATATEAINTIIKAKAEEKGLAFYDANTRLNALSTTGVNVNGSIITNAFVSGGFFSLDGVHLSPRGNAVIANEMMETINAKYGSTLQPVASGTFPTVRLK